MELLADSAWRVINGNFDAPCLPPQGGKQPMMEKRQFAPNLYYQLSLDQLVPQSHPLRQIADAIDFSSIFPLRGPTTATPLNPG
jgi:hypothetical protein